MPQIILPLLAAIGIVIYGFWDAYYPQSSNENIHPTVEIVDRYRIQFGTNAPIDKDLDTLYLQVKWLPIAENKNKIVARLKIKGNLFYENKLIESFDLPCKIGTTQFLGGREALINSQSEHLKIPDICYIPIKTKFRSRTPADSESFLLERNRLNNVISQLKIKDINFEVEVINTPMGYVQWISTQTQNALSFLESLYSRRPIKTHQ